MITEQASGTSRAARNLELVHKGYEAFGRGDMQTVQQLFKPDIVWAAGLQTAARHGELTFYSSAIHAVR